MTFLRRLIVPVVTAALMVGGAAAPAAARDYRTVVDITFPVVAPARYSNDFAAGRSGGRVHRSTDLFSRMGAHVRAARGGTVIWLPQQPSGSAGYAIQILGDDGRTYAYYHMGRAGAPYSRAISRHLAVGRRVARGQFLGWLGDSGNAAGGTPHLHFEIHDNAVLDPYGSNRVNPYASLRAAQGLPIGDRGPAATPRRPTPTGTSAAPLLRLGSRGTAVVAWQRQLNRTRRPVHALVVDGVFGPGTQRATVYFQRERANLGPAGLGVVGPNTRAAMARILAQRAAAPRTPTKPRPRTTPRPRVTTPRPATAPLLRVGSHGPAVTVWQRQLNRTRRPVHALVVDGAFGPGTLRATIYFQRSAGLGPAGLGVVGPNTRAAMQRRLR